MDHNLPGYFSLNDLHSLQFVYNSGNADPQPIISTGATILERAAVPVTISSSLTVAGMDQVIEVFTDTSGLDENRDEPVRQVIQFDASTYPSGAYPFRHRLTSNYLSSSISSGRTGEVLINNQQRSPLGAGWTLDGLQRLHIQDGVIMVTEGDGSALSYDAIPDGFFMDSFEGGASELWSNGSTENVSAFTEFLGRFANETISLTLDNLPAHTGIELHFDFYAIDSWDGTDPNFGAPDEFFVGQGESLDKHPKTAARADPPTGL